MSGYTFFKWVKYCREKGFSGGSVVKNPPANVGDTGDRGLIPESGRSPGGGNGNPLQYSCLEKSMDRGDWQANTVHGVATSWTWLSARTHTHTRAHTHTHTHTHTRTHPVMKRMSYYPWSPWQYWGQWVDTVVWRFRTAVGQSRHSPRPSSELSPTRGSPSDQAACFFAAQSSLSLGKHLNTGHGKLKTLSPKLLTTHLGEKIN